MIEDCPTLHARLKSSHEDAPIEIVRQAVSSLILSRAQLALDPSVSKYRTPQISLPVEVGGKALHRIMHHLAITQQT
jgi:hypothetical protein